MAPPDAPDPPAAPSPADADRLEAQARLASLGMIAAGVAHELSNPLGYVQSNNQFLRTLVDEVLAGGCDPAKARAALEEARGILAENADGIRRMVGITSELRRVARAPAEPKPCDLEEAIDRAVTLAHNALKYKATVVKEYGHPGEVMADEGRLAQVFVNLLVNAAQAIPERGEVRLGTSADGGFAVATCADTGGGMAPDVLARLWDPFFTTKPAGVGTGLGLWIVRRFVEGAGGRVEVQSEVGRGTTFSIRLPLAAP
ncbi:MAG: hypothetical protein FJ087_14665 [Deltaproteobacteria bacterium]|nr:hypothetical protein [Deltaproteobacteria bacterium]